MITNEYKTDSKQINSDKLDFLNGSQNTQKIADLFYILK